MRLFMHSKHLFLCSVEKNEKTKLSNLMQAEMFFSIIFFAYLSNFKVILIVLVSQIYVTLVTYIMDIYHWKKDENKLTIFMYPHD